jgi:leucyl-tRNA synthetase
VTREIHEKRDWSVARVQIWLKNIKLFHTVERQIMSEKNKHFTIRQKKKVEIIKSLFISPIKKTLF